MKFQKSPLVLLFFVVALLVTPIFAQESEPVVVDEVIAQVNDSVITLSRVKREMKNAVESFVQRGMAREEAVKKVEQTEVIASLIDEELIVQKGKEIGVTDQAEAEINQRLIAIMKEQKLKTLDALYEEMKKGGLNPQDIRAGMIRQYIQGTVLQSEVDRKIYFSISAKEMKDYYEKNKVRFTKPEEVSMSEIFLSLAGRNEDEVRAKAAALVVEARKGADFGELAVRNSERPDVVQTKGKVGKFVVVELDEKYATAIKTVKVGGVAEPVETAEGISILRIDERIEASKEAEFDENRVKLAITNERTPAERQKYMNELRKEAFIKLSPNYRDSVTAALYREQQKTAAKPQ